MSCLLGSKIPKARLPLELWSFDDSEWYVLNPDPDYAVRVSRTRQAVDVARWQKRSRSRVKVLKPDQGEMKDHTSLPRWNLGAGKKRIRVYRHVLLREWQTGLSAATGLSGGSV